MKIGTSRLETFSDGVMSIIITIMVLSLKLPDFKHDDTSWRMRHYLVELLPYFLSYAFSFMMIGIFWTNHHHMFHLLERTNESLIWQNLLFLFWMSLIPLVTAIVGANPRLSESIAVYGFDMLMTTLSFAIMRSYTIRKGLIHKAENKTLERKIYSVSIKAETKSYVGAAAYLSSIPLAYLNIFIAYCCFILSAIIFFIPDGIDDEDLSEKIIEKNTQ
ncbi:MAG: TMEM175 family protein [Flavisolibacter sp.]